MTEHGFISLMKVPSEGEVCASADLVESDRRTRVLCKDLKIVVGPRQKYNQKGFIEKSRESVE